MKFNFKIQQYQTDAVEAVARVFAGQGHYDKISYIRDLGKKKIITTADQVTFAVEDEYGNDHSAAGNPDDGSGSRRDSVKI